MGNQRKLVTEKCKQVTALLHQQVNIFRAFTSQYQHSFY